MDIQSYISTTFERDINFEVMKRELRQAPLYLEVRDCDDLFTLMFSDKSPKNDPAVRQSVGPVFDKKDKILRGYSLDRTEELVIDPLNPIWGPVENVDLKTDKVIQYAEGIKLTVYFYGGRWRVSTTRVIDGFASYWSSPKSFGTMFMETCELLYPRIHSQLSSDKCEGPLNKSYSYVFILSTPDHKFVRKISKPTLIHAATFCLENKVFISQDVGVPKQIYIKFSSLSAFQQNIKSLSSVHPGYIIEGDSRLRIMTTKYKSIQSLRGNNPDPFRHYLDARQHMDRKAFDDLFVFYPEFQEIGTYIEEKINELSCAIYELYLAFFIRRLRRPQLDKTLFVTLMQIHSDYQRTSVKRTLEIVYRHISSMPPALLHRLLTNTDYVEPSLPVAHNEA